jgi:hypothetical protein
VANLGRLGLAGASKREVWDRWKTGEFIRDIARAPKKLLGSVHGVLKATGGIPPPQRSGSRWSLSLAEREEISRGLASGDSLLCGPIRFGSQRGTLPRPASAALPSVRGIYTERRRAFNVGAWGLSC